jgi:hypothetical protein
MKTIITIALMLLVSMSFAAACVEKDICVANGYDYTIGKFYFDGKSYKPYGEVMSPFEIEVSGNWKNAAWTADPSVAAVYETSGGRLFAHEGGTEGKFHKSTRFGINVITFCGNEEENEVPEFGTFAALGVLGLAGLFIYKKRN